MGGFSVIGCVWVLRQWMCVGSLCVDVCGFSEWMWVGSLCVDVCGFSVSGCECVLCERVCVGFRRVVPGVVVGARAEDVSQRRPGQTPDHPLMSHLHTAHLLLHAEGEQAPTGVSLMLEATHGGQPRLGATHRGHTDHEPLRRAVYANTRRPHRGAFCVTSSLICIIYNSYICIYGHIYGRENALRHRNRALSWLPRVPEEQ